ncbi:UNVERIFIED_CONTAM: hypothetical protein H355_016976, partial [Colinus virginianus]
SPERTKEQGADRRGSKAGHRGGPQKSVPRCCPGPAAILQLFRRASPRDVVSVAAEGDQDFTAFSLFSSAPGDYRIEAANRHVFKCPPVQSMAFRREPVRTDRPPGPGTYKLPRLLGPNTVYTLASPCYSLRGRSQRGRFDEDLAKVSSAAPLSHVSVGTWAALPVPQGLPSLLQLCLTQASREEVSLGCDASPVRP